MTSNSDFAKKDILNHQAASALLFATLSFFRRHQISKAAILKLVAENYDHKAPTATIRGYKNLIRAYEQMGSVMSTWFSSPRFLDSDFRPVPITTGKGTKSLLNLLRQSRVSLAEKTAESLLRRSPSVKIDDIGNFIALRREFVLPDFEMPRAALVVERYLDTLRRNSSPGKRKAIVLLERNCHVPEIDRRTIAPILRDIKGRGSAFINSIDRDIEGNRMRRAACKSVGEMSVHIFAWTRPYRCRKINTHSKIKKLRS